MKLERRFDWKDHDSVYKAVEEDEVEKTTEGRVRFTCVRISDGRIFSGVSFPSTVAQMVDTKTGFWRLAANPKKPDKSIVIETSVPLSESPRDSESISKDSGRTRTKIKNG